MRELVFALEFRGSAAPVPGSENRLRATTSASGQTLRTLLEPDGVQAEIQSTGGDTAAFQSEVEIVGDGMFLESGTIAYGQAGKISFKTVGRGVLMESPMAGFQYGAVLWEVTGGEGRLQGARGLITSNFTVGAGGEVTDDQFARIYLPA
jgi:hypothetical protein